MFQEAEVRHAADIKQVAADTAKAAAATFAEQLKIILPPPALPTDDDVEEDETADERAGGGRHPRRPLPRRPRRRLNQLHNNPWQRPGRCKAS
jgi:hypothetical protein